MNPIIIFQVMLSWTVSMLVSSTGSPVVSSALSKVDPIMNNTDYYGSYEYSSSKSSEEQACPRTHFYHIRGRQCVPFKCPGGNSLRDYATGECIHEDGGDDGESKKQRSFLRTAYVFHTTKFRHTPKLSYSRMSTATRSTWAGESKRVKIALLDEHQETPIRTFLGMNGR